MLFNEKITYWLTYLLNILTIFTSYNYELYQAGTEIHYVTLVKSVFNLFILQDSYVHSRAR